MIDQQMVFNKQLSEFLSEYKQRFSILNYPGMPGKIGYATKLNRKEINSSLNIFLTDRFPLEAPLFYVNPKFNHDILDMNGRVIDDSVRIWNINSNLKNSINIVLNKLEGNLNPIQQNQNVKQMFNQNVSQEDDIINSEIVKDLNAKSIDELLFIYFNQDDYVYEFTQKIRTNNEKLLQEVSELSENTEKLKSQYEDIKLLVEDFKKQYLEKENELKELYSQKQLIDSNFTVEKLIEEMRKSIEDNYQKPRQKLINEFLSKKIDIETFKESFKELSVKYHYYNLIKDKMNLYK